MIIDEQGILVLSASTSDNVRCITHLQLIEYRILIPLSQNSKVITKKFPLSDFRSPYIPDQDRQELPNSVVLDFRDGSTLQCACEHPQAQAGVLQSMLPLSALSKRVHLIDF